MEERIQAAQEFLNTQLGEKLNKLTGDSKAKFGVMSPQHMLEHMIKTVKISTKVYGEVPETPTDAQKGFRKFMYSDMPFPEPKSDASKLEDLRLGSLEEAKQALLDAVKGFYQKFEENPELKPFNPTFGQLKKEDLEVFHAKHLKHHFNQFGLLD